MRVVKPATMSIEMEIGDVVCNSKGVKSAQLTNKKGAPLFERLTGIDEPITTPFGASTFNDSAATRKNICFRCTPKLAKRLAAIGPYLQSYIDKHNGRLFKNKKLPYKPLRVPPKDDYEPRMCCKNNAEQGAALESPNSMTNTWLGLLEVPVNVPQISSRFLTFLGSNSCSGVVTAGPSRRQWANLRATPQ